MPQPHTSQQDPRHQSPPPTHPPTRFVRLLHSRLQLLQALGLVEARHLALVSPRPVDQVLGRGRWRAALALSGRHDIVTIARHRRQRTTHEVVAALTNRQLLCRQRNARLHGRRRCVGGAQDHAAMPRRLQCVHLLRRARAGALLGGPRCCCRGAPLGGAGSICNESRENGQAEAVVSARRRPVTRLHSRTWQPPGGTCRHCQLGQPGSITSAPPAPSLANSRAPAATRWARRQAARRIATGSDEFQTSLVPRHQHQRIGWAAIRFHGRQRAAAQHGTAPHRMMQFRRRLASGALFRGSPSCKHPATPLRPSQLSNLDPSGLLLLQSRLRSLRGGYALAARSCKSAVKRTHPSGAAAHHRPAAATAAGSAVLQGPPTAGCVCTTLP